MRQTIDGNPYKAQMVVVPQRERFGMCGPVANQLSVDAWSEEYGRKSDFLAPRSDDIINNESLINTYTLPLNIFNSTLSLAAPLPPCSGPLRDTVSWEHILSCAFTCPRIGTQRRRRIATYGHATPWKTSSY